MNVSTATLRLKLTQVAEQLRQLTQVNLQSQWHAIDLMSVTEPMGVDQRGYIVWEQGKQRLRLRQKIIVPPILHGYPLTGLSLRILLSWWAQEAQIFINHQFVQAGDLFDNYTR
ncbi:MAG: hypothetical protein ACKPFF_30740, partial [Planktothrix sp.]